MSAAHIAQTVYAECLRIEHKYSRYRDDSFFLCIAIPTVGLMWMMKQLNCLILLKFYINCQIKNLIIPLVYLEKFGVLMVSEQVPSLDQINQLLPSYWLGQSEMESNLRKKFTYLKVSLDFGGIGKNTR